MAREPAFQPIRRRVTGLPRLVTTQRRLLRRPRCPGAAVDRRSRHLRPWEGRTHRRGTRRWPGQGVSRQQRRQRPQGAPHAGTAARCPGSAAGTPPHARRGTGLRRRRSPSGRSPDTGQAAWRHEAARSPDSRRRCGRTAPTGRQVRTPPRTQRHEQDRPDTRTPTHASTVSHPLRQPRPFSARRSAVKIDLASASDPVQPGSLGLVLARWDVRQRRHRGRRGYSSILPGGSDHPGSSGLWPSYSSGTRAAARRNRRT